MERARRLLLGPGKTFTQSKQAQFVTHSITLQLFFLVTLQVKWLVSTRILLVVSCAEIE